MKSKVKDSRKVAQQILQALGGKENVSGVMHCATRLRIVLNDDTKANKEDIENIDGVSGYFVQSGQHQIILGTGFVVQVYNELKEDGVETEGVKDKAQEKLSFFQKLTRNFSDIFVPIIPVLVATGLLMGLRGLLVDGFGIELSGGLLTISQVLTDTAFIFIPVLVAWSTMKKFGGTPIIGIVLGLMLVAPQLPDKWAVVNNQVNPLSLDILGMTFNVSGFQSSILPAVFLGWFAATIEKKIRKIVPNVLDLILTPFLTLLISLLVGLIVVGPTLMVVERTLTEIILGFIGLPFGLGGLVYGGGIQFLAVTGMHHTITPIMVSLVAETGRDFINPLGTAAIAGQAGAGLAIALAQVNKVKKSAMISSVIPAFFGITEPIMFATNLPRIKPFLMGCVGGAIGGWAAALFNLAAQGTGATMLPGMLLYIGDGLLQYVLVIVIAFAVGFIGTKLASKKEN